MVFLDIGQYDHVIDLGMLQVADALPNPIILLTAVILEAGEAGSLGARNPVESLDST